MLDFIFWLYEYRTHSAMVEAISKICEATRRYSFLLALDGPNLCFTHEKSLRPNCSNIQRGKIFLYPHINYIMQPPDGNSGPSNKLSQQIVTNCGRVINRREFFSIFSSCHKRGTATEKMKSFFRTSENLSFKSDVFTVKKFEFTAMKTG